MANTLVHILTTYSPSGFVRTLYVVTALVHYTPYITAWGVLTITYILYVYTGIPIICWLLLSNQRFLRKIAGYVMGVNDHRVV